MDPRHSPTNGQVFGFNLGTGGVIGSSIGAAVPTGLGPSARMVIDPNGKLMAVENNVDGPPGTISMYLVGSGGVLKPTSPATVNAENAPLYVTFYNAP